MASYQARNQNKPLIKNCFNCGAKIRLMPDPTGRTKEDGKPRYLPFEADDLAQRHQCLGRSNSGQASEYKNKPNREKSNGVRCKICNDGTMIMFSDDQKSKSGKYIPLEMTGEPHQHRQANEEDTITTYQGEQEGFQE